MSKQVQTVIIGAGIVGVSVAYHLTQMGAKNILVIDKGDLDENDGSTSHAPGGLRVVTPSDFYTRLGSASRRVYDQLPLAKEGQEQFFRTGAVQVASKAERFDNYRRIQEMGYTMGIDTELLSSAEVVQKIPLIDANKIVGGLWIPDAGVVKTSLLATSMRQLAAATGGATFVSDTTVTDVIAPDGQVQAVLTDNPDLARVECERIVLCSNIWAPLLCEKLGVNMPLFPGQHQYIFTEPVEALKPYADVEAKLPLATMDDVSIYYRQHFDRIGIGSYAHKAMLVDPHKLGKKAELPFTPQDFSIAWSLIQELMPPLKTTEVSHGFNGMFAFTVDGFPILGESAAVKGFWTAVGPWLSYASEVGRVMAHWMLEGDPGMDMRQADVNRFHLHQINRQYLTHQSKYFYEIGFDILHPNEVASDVRNLRLPPYHERMKALGAVGIPFAGIETAYWYESNEPLVEKHQANIPLREGWDATFWSPILGAEHLELRQNVGLVDWNAGIGPIEVRGSGATTYLNYLCTNKIDKPVGTIIYTLLLTPNGGIKRDMTIVRLAEDRYWVLTGKANMPAELVWMRRFAPQDGTVTITDYSEQYVSLALWGSNARKVLQKVTSVDVGNEAFPFYTMQKIDVGLVSAVALRLSYAGELGWELYAPASYGLTLWDTLWEAGREFDMPACGLGSLLSLRLEKGYRLYGTDMHTEYNAYQAGLSWLLNYKKGDFVGRAASLVAKDAPRRRKLCCLTFDNPKAIMYGFEPVFADGKVVGRITGANYGYSIGKFIAYAYLDNEYSEVGTRVEVQYTGRRYQGVVAQEPLFDPNMARLKA